MAALGTRPSRRKNPGDQIDSSPPASTQLQAPLEPTNGSERLLRPAVIQRKMTNGYRAMWAAEGEADIPALSVSHQCQEFRRNSDENVSALRAE